MNTAKPESEITRRRFLVALHAGGLLVSLGAGAGWLLSAQGKRSALQEKLERDAATGSALYVFALGRESYLGKNIPQDRAKAFACFEQAGAAGHNTAMLLAGTMCLEGDGVPKDAARGARWMQKSADLSSPMGMYHLSTLYAKGQGIPQDTGLARDWMKKSAKAGAVSGMLDLARDLASEGDLAQAYAWYAATEVTAEKGFYWNEYHWNQTWGNDSDDAKTLAKKLKQAAEGKAAVAARSSPEELDKGKMDSVFLYQQVVKAKKIWSATELDRSIRMAREASTSGTRNEK